jgi:hypothetical protein
MKTCIDCREPTSNFYPAARKQVRCVACHEAWLRRDTVVAVARSRALRPIQNVPTEREVANFYNQMSRKKRISKRQ